MHCCIRFLKMLFYPKLIPFKKSQQTVITMLFLTCFAFSNHAQLINVNGNVTIDELILDNFVDGCVEVTNISSPVNGNASGFRSYGTFTRGNSNFPFENGIVLTTGNAESGGNNITTTTLSEGATTWGSDPDLENALGINNTLNATSIQFNFVSISNRIQFNYLLASEEYSGVNPCNVSDGFAFLIREAGSGQPYQNIAVLPGTTTPVNTNTVHDEIVGVCPAQNEQYFDGYNLGDTNYNGRTEVLTASTTITPYVTYDVKLVIADFFDNTFDSAVFIEGDSFQIVDLGENIDTCAQLITLNADIQNPSSTYRWFLNNSATPITGATNPTYNATQSGTYRVEITTPLGSSFCVEEDEIMVTLANELNLNPITDYTLCDDLSGNGVENFNLSTKNAEVIAIIPFANYSFSYHLSNADAVANSNPQSGTIQNTSQTQTIHIRINDTDTGCIAYSTFNLVVNTIPNITDPTPLEICDVDDNPSDGITAIDLTEKDNEITNGNTDYIVSYHYNNVDATTGNNGIDGSYVNSGSTDTVFVRVINTNTQCYNTTQLTINITNGPVVNRSPAALDGCDTDYDGTDTFDLTQAINAILDGLTGVTVTFHENTTDAENNTNAIPNPTNYENVTPEVQTVFVRIEDNTTGCASIVPLEIHTNLLLTGTDTGDFALCDDASNDSKVDFNLNIVERYILANFLDENGNLPPGYNVTFYESITDRDNRTNPIDKNLLYEVTQRTTLYIVIESGSCSEVDDIELLVNPILVFTPIDPVTYCDDDDDGFVSIELASFDDLITGGNTDFSVAYFSSFADADIAANPLPPFYQNTQPVETIFARIENIGSGCYTVNEFEIEVVAAPAITQPQPIRICDLDGDGLNVINLEDQIPNIVASTNNLNISFHLSDAEAQANTNPIPNTTNFETATRDIFIRIENNASECFAIATLNIYINTIPVVTDIANFSLCEDDNDQTTDFLFSDWDPEILNGQTGKDVLYFEDAALTRPIDKTVNYQNISSPQTIYVRVENITDPDCYTEGSFFIEVGENPVYGSPGSFLICDDPSNDGRGMFDFSEKIDQMALGSTTNLDIRFFSSEQNAIDNTGALPLNYTNTSNPEQIFVRIENVDSKCVIIEDFGINVVAAPSLSEAEPLAECDDDYDGTTLFNLENAQYQVFDRFQNNIAIHYFEDINAVDDNTLAITNPTSYLSESKTVFIKYTNNQTTCYTVISLPLEVLPLTEVNFNGTYPICDNDTDTFDLSTMNPILVDDTNSVSISYFNSLTDAQNNTGALGTIYNYTASSHEIFTRFENLTNGCVAYNSFTLQINQNPIANTPSDLIKCDDDFDGVLVFDLTEVNPEILGSQLATAHEITYYNNLLDAEEKNNRLNNLHEASSGNTIYVRLEHRATGCFSTTAFNTIINPLPIVPVNDVVALCLDNLPLVIDASTGNPNDSYLWTTSVNTAVNNSTSPQITINNPQEIGDYTLTITTQHNNADNCSYAKTISVIQSEQADVVATASSSFTDPNRVTVSVSGIGNYVYRLDDGEPQTSNIFDYVPLGPHTITIEDLNGCSPITTEVFVIDIPKFVTPNGDGDFDTWHIVGIDQLPGTEIFIYNRHGKLLKMLTHNSPGWDGTFNGHNMPSDDYWFSANIIQNGESFNITGHFTLKR